MSAQEGNSKLIITIIIVIGAVGVMIWGALVEQDNFTTWEDTDIACLMGGHTNIAHHIHAQVRIFVDGEEQVIPSGVGINTDCMAEVHTHDRSGEVHIETAGEDLDIRLKDFFAVWDKPLSLPGYERSISVNGESIVDPSYKFADGDSIEIRYQQASASSSATTTGDR